ncbi:MAG: ABC transporter ATP-binding protein [Gammaproteobacteria bacterium]|nr:ABC transporter ATP-binding protein [Gammaproteobacteria bacterium]
MSAIVLRQAGKQYVSYAHEWDRLWEVLTRRPRHRSFQALSDINLMVPHGQVLGIVGKNGAGKSTLLKLMAGTLLPSAGSVEVNGRVAALLELGSGFHPEMTGRENVYLTGAIMGLTQAEIDRLYPEIVAFAGIGEFIDQPVKTYSSGMFVRLAFAVATCVEPDILIIDEALSVGDGAFARKSFERIKAIRDHGKTILFCSHSLYQVEAICNRVIWIDQGRVRVDGEPAAVVTAYNNFLAGEASASPDAATGVAAMTALPVHGTARLTGVVATVGGKNGSPLELETGRSDLQITTCFDSDPALPCPSVALAFLGEDQRIVTSAGTHNDGLTLARDPLGRGEVSVIFSKFPLLKGNYWLSVYLLGEDGVHVYDQAFAAVELRVSQRGLEQGLVSLPRRWLQPAGVGADRDRQQSL